VRSFRNPWELPQFAEYVLKIEKILLASVPHASASLPVSP